MSNASPRPDLLALAELRRAGGKTFALTPDADALREIADDLELRALRKLRFTGKIMPEGKSDWRLEGQLGATVTQACSVSLADVVTRIDTDVLRRYIADFTAPEAEETEMPEDESIEPLPAKIDLYAVMTEALALALPDYPRAPDAATEDDAADLVHIYSASPPNPGPVEAEVEPPQTANPLSALQELRDKLAQSPADSGDAGASKNTGSPAKNSDK